ncbi:MAG: pyruvate kinase [Candidatus Absconditabacteria bacterium]|nr:pyruvate kinase [Candidatus Absconditabacteria bacterium]
MTNFHFGKIIAGVSPTLAKETVLSKIINMVDVFKISLGGGFDDNNKKYIDTLMKLDNSKTIMLETRGNDVRIKNVVDIKLKDKQKIEVEYSEYAQEHNEKIFVDATFLSQLKPGQEITFEQSGIKLKVKETKEDLVLCEVINGGDLIQYDRVSFPKFEIEIPFLGEREKKDILRGLEYGIHVIAASLTNSKDNIFELKEFLASQNREKMKVFAKIETEEGLKNIDELIKTADGIILVKEKLGNILDEKTEKDIFKRCKQEGKPLVITFGLTQKKNSKGTTISEQEIKKYCGQQLDCYMLNTLLKEEDTINMITDISELLEEHELCVPYENLGNFYKENEDFLVRDYIIYNAYRITNEVNVKAIVSYTENGYTSSRLSSLKPQVPLIAFTKIDETYRYINMLRGVRGYKISQSFNYENLKRVGKEMIRIIFKGNISLDDKIIIVQANEIIKDEKTGMINGVELYKFKNI